jgi:hypothetical protein
MTVVIDGAATKGLSGERSFWPNGSAVVLLFL